MLTRESERMIVKKANIARELLETERLYVQNLHILNDVRHPPFIMEMQRSLMIM